MISQSELLKFIKQNPDNKDSNNVLLVVKSGLLTNRDFVIKLVALNGLFLEYVSDEFKCDLEVALAAVKSRGESFKFVSASLYQNKELIVLALKSSYDSFLPILPKLDNHFFSDLDVMLPALKRSAQNLRFASPEIQDNEEIVGELIQRDVYAFRYASPRIKNSKEWALRVLPINPHLIQFMSKELKQDTDLIKLVLSKNGSVLQHLGKKIQDDEGWVFLAYIQDILSLTYASTRLQKVLFNAQDPVFALVSAIETKKLENSLPEGHKSTSTFKI